jgi:hypothetical protein
MIRKIKKQTEPTSAAGRGSGRQKRKRGSKLFTLHHFRSYVSTEKRKRSENGRKEKKDRGWVRRTQKSTKKKEKKERKEKKEKKRREREKRKEKKGKERKREKRK